MLRFIVRTRCCLTRSLLVHVLIFIPRAFLEAFMTGTRTVTRSITMMSMRMEMRMRMRMMRRTAEKRSKEGVILETGEEIPRRMGRLIEVVNRSHILVFLVKIIN